jgi:uncharacterized membrane protein (DUF4010 family)
MEPGDAFVSLGLSLLMGLLVGLQRERSEPHVAGVRTFGLITVLGTASAIVGTEMPGGAWVVGAGLIGLIGALAIGNMLSRRAEAANPGITTEVAALVMYAVGALMVTGPREAALATGASVAILLQVKKPLHEYVRDLGEHDVRAILQFALLTAVILPIVPDRAMGPFGVLNPRQIWLMVVLVVGMSLGGYLLYKSVGERMGLILAGVLGGVISSTATTVSYARRALSSPDQVAAAAFVITAASSVLYARLLVEISAAAPGQFADIAPPVAIMGAVSVVIAIVMWRRASQIKDGLPAQQNPTELKTAFVFAAVYAVVLVAAAAAHEYVGNKGIYAVAMVSGLTDMDAITLSSSRLAADGTLTTATAWRAIIIASMANGVFKMGVITFLGGRALAARMVVIFAIKMAAGAALLVLWPY